MRIAAAGLALLSIALTACGSETRPSPARPEYSVVAELLTDGRGPVKICAGELLSYPPQCDGPEVRGVNIRSIEGAYVYPGGTISVYSVKVVGTWDGLVLTATHPPRRMPNSQVTRIPACAAGPSKAVHPDPVETKIAGDWAALKARGIFIVEMSPCADHVQVVVPVPDRATVTYLTETYGPLNIVGWFIPV